MDDFTQFDAFERCREFARGIAELLNRGAFSKDPVLTTALLKTLLSIYSNKPKLPKPSRETPNV